MRRLPQSPQNKVSLRRQWSSTVHFKYRGRQSRLYKGQLHLYQALIRLFEECQRCSLYSRQGLGQFDRSRPQSTHQALLLTEEDYLRDLHSSQEAGFALTVEAR